MTHHRKKLLCSTAIALGLGLGAAALSGDGERGSMILPAFILTAAASCAPCTARATCAPCEPCAAANPCAACAPCEPCAACGPCDPCAAAPASSTGCYVPRLKQAAANPCAAKNPCAAAATCDPCGAKNPCAAENPCAATAACDPCAAKNPCAAENPCAGANPCAAAACAPCMPADLTGPAGTAAVQKELNKRGFKAGSIDGVLGPQTATAIREAEAAFGLPVTGKITPELAEALFTSEAAAACAACAPCEPCAAANPCAACAPCEPCAACAPCEPATKASDVTEEEVQALYECIIDYMRTAYGDEWKQTPTEYAARADFPLMQVAYRDSELSEATDFVDWRNFATAPYVSATHGERFVTNHVNDTGAEAYGRYEDIGEMPVGGVIAKPSFTISGDGEALLGPLFLMEKMESGFHEPSDDWKYTLVTPEGDIGGVTQGQGAENVEFCIGCHKAAPEGQDSLFLLPEDRRVR